MLKYYTSFLILLLIFLLGLKPGIGAVAPQSEETLPIHSWEELLPYIGRHIGMRPNEKFRFAFDIGGDFGPLAQGLDTSLDRTIKEVLINNEAQLAGILKDLLRPGILVPHKTDVFGKKIPLTQEEINQGSHNLWQEALNQDPPVVLTHLKFLMARELQGKIRIKGLDLKPTLSNHKKIRWREVKPYVTAFMKVTNLSKGTVKNAPPQLAIRICMTDNNLSKEIPGDELDWRVAMAVFDTLTQSLLETDFFSERVDALLHPMEQDLSIHSLSKIEKHLHQKIQADYAFVHVLKGLIAHQFAKNHLPPLVD